MEWVGRIADAVAGALAPVEPKESTVIASGVLPADQCSLLRPPGTHACWPYQELYDAIDMKKVNHTITFHQYLLVIAKNGCGVRAMEKVYWTPPPERQYNPPVCVAVYIMTFAELDRRWEREEWPRTVNGAGWPAPEDPPYVEGLRATPSF